MGDGLARARLDLNDRARAKAGRLAAQIEASGPGEQRHGCEVGHQKQDRAALVSGTVGSGPVGRNGSARLNEPRRLQSSPCTRHGAANARRWRRRRGRAHETEFFLLAAVGCGAHMLGFLECNRCGDVSLNGIKPSRRRRPEHGGWCMRIFVTSPNVHRATGALALLALGHRLARVR